MVLTRDSLAIQISLSELCLLPYFALNGKSYNKTQLIVFPRIVQCKITLQIFHSSEKAQIPGQYFRITNILMSINCLRLSVLWVAYATHSTLKPVPILPR
jgi:hypothetical protein